MTDESDESDERAREHPDAGSDDTDEASGDDADEARNDGRDEARNGGVDGGPVRLVEGIAEVADLEDFLDELDAIRDETGATVQAFDARYVVSRSHLYRAADLAARAFDRDENVARDRAVEILLYAAGRRQIDQALEIGIDEGTGPAVVLVDGRPAADPVAAARPAADAVAALLEPAATLGEYDRSLVRQYFDVSDAELRATTGDLSDVVLERVALLDVKK